MSGKQWESQHGFPTPDSVPETSACRTFSVPASDEWLGVLMGALMPLRETWAWYQWGSLTEQQAADAWNDIILAAFGEGTGLACLPDVETPYWDDASDVGTSEPAVSQTWYGTVTDAEAPPGELDFVENALVWTFTGLLAISGTPAAAILFHTIAPRFVVAMRGGDIAEVFRIILDGQEQASVDTTGHAGEVVEVPVQGSYDISDHLLMVVKRS